MFSFLQCTRHCLSRFALCALFFAFPLTGAFAAPYYWRTAAPDNNWQNVNNWSTVGFAGAPAAAFPGPADEAIFGSLAETPNPITFTNIPLAGVGSINASTLQVTITIPAGETLTITSTGSNAGGNAVIQIAPGATLRILNSASIAAAGSGHRWRIFGTLDIVGNGAVASNGIGFYPGSTLRYSGAAAKTVGFEMNDGNINDFYAGGFPGNIIVDNVGGVTLNIPAGVTRRFLGLITVNAGATFVAAPSGLFPIFQHEGGITVNSGGALQIRETMDLRAGLASSFVNVLAGGRLQVAGQATASSVNPGIQSIVYADATALLEFVNGLSTAAFGTVGTNHLVPATMPGSIVCNNTGLNLLINGGARVIQGDFTVAPSAGFLTFDSTTDITLQGNIAWNNATINFSDANARLTIAGAPANAITGTLGGFAPLSLFGITMNRATQTLTLRSSFNLQGGSLQILAGTVALVNAGTTLTTGLGANQIGANGALTIGDGVTFRVRAGTNFQNDGVVNISNAGAGGTLECEGDNNPNVRMTGTGAYLYGGANATLAYTGGTASMAWSAGPELPATMPGRVRVNKTANSNLFITSAANIAGGLIVENGYCSALAGGNVTLGAGSQVQNGAFLQAGASAVIAGGANLTVQTGGQLDFLSSPTASWTGTPTYQAGSTLRYFNTTRTTGDELPPIMAGNVLIFGASANVTLGADRQINGNFTMEAMPDNGAFSTGAFTLTPTGTNTIGQGATFTVATGGKLNLGAGNLAGMGNYTQQSGGTLQFANVNGVNHASGAIRLTGTRIYDSNAHYIFDDAGANGATNFGGAHVGNLTVNFSTPHRLLLSAGTTVNGVLTVNTGEMELNNQALTIAASGGLQINNGARLLVTCFGASMTVNSPAANNSVNNGGVLWVGANALTLNQNVTIQTGGVLEMSGPGGCGGNGGITGPGAIVYASGGANLRFVGAWNGTVTNTFFPSIMPGSVEVANADVITLNGSKTIAGTLTLTTGRIASNGFTLTVDAGNLTGGSATSYLDCAGGGALQMNFPAGLTAPPYLYPIGAGAGFYRPITLSNTTMSAPGGVSARVVAGAPGGATDGAGFVGIAAVPEYWSVQGANLTSAQARPSRAPTPLAADAVLGFSTTLAGAYSAQTAMPNSPAAGDIQSGTALGQGFYAIGSGPSAVSDIIETPGYTYATNIPHAVAANREPASPTAMSAALWSIRVRDGGAAPDADMLATELNSITLNITTDSPTNPLYQVALFTPGGTPIGAPQPAAASVTFSGLAGPNVTANDDGFIDIVVRGTFKETNVMDSANVRFQVAAATANPSGSTFALPNAGGAISVNNTLTGLPADRFKNRIDIVATQLVFPNAIGNQIVNTNFTPSITVLAVDAYNNIDRSVTGTMTLSGAPISAGGSDVVALGSGTASFSGLQVSGTGSFTLTATLGALTGVSASFNVTNSPTYWGCTPPSTPPVAPVLGIGGRNMNFTGVSLNGMGNSITVNQGATVNIVGNWNMTWGGSPYCPTCVVQMYIGIGGGSGISGDGSSPTGFTHCIGSVVWNGSGGSFNYNFTAPTKPGIYYISQNWSLHYYCNPYPITFSNDPTYAIAVIEVIDNIVGAAGSCNQADIIPTPGFTYQTNIPYSTYTGPMSGAHPAVWSFRLRDFGTIPSQGDIDNKPSVLNSIGIMVNDPNGVLQEIALYNGTGLIETQPVSGSGLVTFSSPAVPANIIAPDDGFFDVIVRARFRTTPITPPMDNRQFSFSINEANVVLAGAAISTQKATTFPLVGPSSTAGDNNRVEVTATQLQFSLQPPLSTPVGVPMAPAVTARAVDANGNLDEDYAAPNISLSHPNLIGSPVSLAPTAGAATFTALAFNSLVAGGVLTANSGALAAANSAMFNIVPATFHFTSPAGDANILTNWELNGAGAHPAALGLSGATYIVGATPAPTANAQATGNVTIAPGSTLTVNAGSTLTVNAGVVLTNNGTLQIQGGATLRLLDDGSVSALSANAVVYAATTATLEYAAPASAPRVSHNRELPAAMNGRLVVSRPASDFTLDAAKTIAGEFVKSGLGGFIVNGANVLTLLGGATMSGGSWTASNTAQIIANGSFVKTAGTLIAQNDASLTFNGGFVHSVGAVSLNNASTLALNGSSLWSGGTLASNGSGHATVGAAGALTLAGGFVNLNSTGELICNGAFANPGGTLNIGASAARLNGAVNFSAGAAVNSTANAGTLSIGGAGALTGALNYVSAGLALVEMNRAGATLNLATGAPLVTGTLTLTNGVVKTTDYVLVTGALTASGNPGTYIDGKLRRQLSGGALVNAGPFLFPLGKAGRYLPLTYLDVNGNALQMQAEVFSAPSGGMSGPLFTNISLTEYWRAEVISGVFSSARIQLGRSDVPLAASAVVGRSATQNGSYAGLGGAVSTPNVASVSPDTAGASFYAIGSLPNTFFYISGAAEEPTNWNSDVNGLGAPSIDFETAGATYIVPAGRIAEFTADTTFAPGVIVAVNGGGALRIRNGARVQFLGVLRINADGALLLADSATVVAPSGVFYLAPTSRLGYEQPAGRVASAVEFPNQMQGSVSVSSGTLILNTNASSRAFSIQGALSLTNAALDFGLDSTSLRLLGAISFNPSRFKANATHRLAIAGSGAIQGFVRVEGNALGALAMERAGAVLNLGDSLVVHEQLSLQNGVVRPPSGIPLILASAADTALLGGSFSSYVAGAFARALPPNLAASEARTHFYPVGVYPADASGKYLPLTLIAATTGSVRPIVAAEAFDGGAGGSVALGVSGALSASEHWRVRAVSGDFDGARVGVLRWGANIAPDNVLGVSPSRAGAYSSLGGQIVNIPQGESLVGSLSARLNPERFLSLIAPTPLSPRITGFSPSLGGAQTVMTINGTNLSDVSAVAIGGVAVASFTVLSSTTIIVTVGEVLSGPVQIGSPAGGAATDSAFTYIPPPQITGVQPPTASPGTPVVLTGSNLSGVSGVAIGGVSVSPSGFTVAPDGSSLSVVVPSAATNSTLIVSSPGGQFFSTSALVVVPPPIISSFNPTLATTGAAITLFGEHFIGVQSVLFGAANALFTVNSPTRITAIVPERASTEATQTRISVRTSSGVATTATLFAYHALPSGAPSGVDPLRQVVISAILDATARLGGRVRITGANLELMQQITLQTSLGSTTASWFINSSASMTLLVPTTGLLAGTNSTLSSAPVTIDALGAFNRVVVPNAFTLFNEPRIVSIEPPNAEIGADILVSGFSLNLISSVSVGGVPATFRLLDSGRMIVRLPSVTLAVDSVSGDTVRIPASGRIEFTSSLGVTGASVAVVNLALASGMPVITRFTPASGLPGIEIQIEGYNLHKTTGVEIAGVTAANFTVQSPTLLRARLSAQPSARASGPVTVRVASGEGFDSRELFRFDVSLEGDLEILDRLASRLGAPRELFQIEVADNRVTVLRLSRRGLQGAFPQEILALSELRELDLSHNALEGGIPANLAALSRLERLNLSHNRFSGAVPEELLCAFPHLRFLDLSRNNLSGPIPRCLTTLQRLETANLAVNRFSGSIPAELGRMSSLTELRLHDNALSGGLPAELGAPLASPAASSVAGKKEPSAVQMSAPTLQIIDLSRNALSGKIPEEWGNIPLLRELRLNECGLRGELPRRPLWQGVAVLEFDGNALTGVIPPFFAQRLRTFSARGNRLQGALPAEFSEAFALRRLDLTGNRIQRLPDMSAARRLDTVLLDGNRLEFGSLEFLASAAVFSAKNQDAAPLPEELRLLAGEEARVHSGIFGSQTRYRWTKNGEILQRATGATLVIAAVRAGDEGEYACIAENDLVPGVQIRTTPIRLSVQGGFVADAPRLVFPPFDGENIAPAPILRWTRARLAESYTIIVAKDRALRDGAQSVVVPARDFADDSLDIVEAAWTRAGGASLERGERYFWTVRANMQNGSAWSPDTTAFRIAPFGQNLAFATVNLGRAAIGESARATGVVVNIGEEVVTLQSAEVESALRNVFAVNLAGRRLEKESEARFEVVFTPDRADTLKAAVTLRYADENGANSRAISVERALVGVGGPLFVGALDFDTVRVGKTAVQGLRIVNRSAAPVALRAARIIVPRGVEGLPALAEDVFTFVESGSQSLAFGRTLDPQEEIFAPIRCASSIAGLKSAQVEIVADNDLAFASVRAVARLQRPDDPALALRAKALPVAAPPGAAVRVDVVIDDYTQERGDSLLKAAQPEVRLVLRFDRQVLAFDANGGGGARLLAGASSSSDSSLVLVNALWQGRSPVVAQLPFRAVAGARTTTKLEIVNVVWGSSSATTRPEWERRVFVEELDTAKIGHFTTNLSRAGGQRRIAAVQTPPAPLISLLRPNPSDETTSFSLILPEAAALTIDILTMKGDVAQSVVSNLVAAAGEHVFNLNVRHLPTGSYRVRVRAGKAVVSERLDVRR
jgi:Leucine-rich repeat (LRR) protein